MPQEQPTVELSPRAQRLMWWFVGAFVMILATNAATAFAPLLWQKYPRFTDLELRYRELQYVAQGIDPMDVGLGVRAPIDDEGLGPLPEWTGYPPWSYAFAEALVTRLSWRGALTCFAGWCIASAAYLAWWAYRCARPYGAAPAWLFALLVLSSNGIYQSLLLGNYSLIVTALIVAALDLQERGRHAWAGAALGWAMVKPHLAAPFIWAALIRGRLLTVIVAAAMVAAASAVTALRLHADPLKMLRRLLEQSDGYNHVWYGLFHGLVYAGASTRTVVRLGMAFGVIATTVIAWRYRRNAPLVYALTALVDHVCTYHFRYDESLLAIPLIVLGETALRTQRTTAWALFGLMTTVLFVRLPVAHISPTISYASYALWIFVAVELIRHAKSEPTPRALQATPALT